MPSGRAESEFGVSEVAALVRPEIELPRAPNVPPMTAETPDVRR